MSDELSAARDLARGVSYAVATLSFVACSSGGAPLPREIAPPPAPSASGRSMPVASAAAPTPAIPSVSATELAMRDWLDSEGVYHDRFVRRVIFTWTTTEQAAELRKMRTLLTKTAAARGRAMFDVELETRTEPIAKILRDPAFAKKRFAWANPWATSRGLWSESYGSALVRVTLRSGSLVLSFDATAPKPLRAFQIDDNVEVGIETAVSQPMRIAAVYHVSRATDPMTHEALPFREYALVNESMIEGWELGTPAVTSDLDVNLEMLRTVKSALALSRGTATATASPLVRWAADVATDVWPKFAGPRQSIGGFEQLSQRYAAALAFLTPAYALDERAVDAEIAALEATDKTEALDVKDYHPFPALQPSSVPPSPKPTGGNCFNGSFAVPCRPRR